DDGIRDRNVTGVQTCALPILLMRRSMMRIAGQIARRQGCEALITGQSLAQVASQTVQAIRCTDAAQDLPVLRPLIGMDKTEIIEDRKSTRLNSSHVSISYAVF